MSVKRSSSRQPDCRFYQTVLHLETFFSSDNKFITANRDGRVCLVIDGELKKTEKFKGKVPLVDFINGEIVVATTSGKLKILNENLDVKKEFSAGAVIQTNAPTSLSGNETFIAVGSYTGVVRYYEKNGDKNPTVRYKFKF